MPILQIEEKTNFDLTSKAYKKKYQTLGFTELLS